MVTSVETAGRGSGQQRDRPALSRSGPVLRGSLRVVGLSAIALILLYIGGFLAFLISMDRQDQAETRKADAIVVLTGGSERISDAVHWLARGQGQRLLISGVGSHVKAERLTSQTPQLSQWLSCCVDVGRTALNTVGNAQESRKWALQNRYRSLLVVTSSYHMPRALVEFGRHMPEIELIPAPVVTTRLQDLHLTADTGLLRTLLVEYSKFLVAYARARLTDRPGLDDIAQSSTRPRA